MTVYLCRWADWASDDTEIMAPSARQAVGQFMASRGALLSTESPTVIVRRAGTTDELRFRVVTRFRVELSVELESISNST